MGNIMNKKLLEKNLVNKNLQLVVLDKGSDIYLEVPDSSNLNVENGTATTATTITAVILGKSSELNINIKDKEVALELSELFHDIADML